jgi:hypothetical protein
MERHVIEEFRNTGHLKSYTQNTTEKTPPAVVKESEGCPEELKEGAD